MALKKRVFILAFAITLFLLLSILLIGSYLNTKRQSYIDEATTSTYGSLNEMQLFWLMSQTYGNDMACLAFKSKLQDLDKSIWNLGLKLDQYRAASEEFAKDPYYQEQKITFNENEVMYLMLLRNLKKACDYNQTIILFFYQNSSACNKCDDQSFVLTDINKDIDPYISIFSFDMDLNISTIKLLDDYYKIGEYPCTIVEDKVMCGMQDKAVVMRQVCTSASYIPECTSKGYSVASNRTA